MKTKIVCRDLEEPLEVKESYETVRSRLYRGELFIEVTTIKGKMLLNKKDIVRVFPVTHKEKTLVQTKN
jgi:hypothetical protein